MTIVFDSGDRIGVFEIIGGLPDARGGMSTVYKGRQRQTGLFVALKVTHEHNFDFYALVKEADTLPRLSHPHIVRPMPVGIDHHRQPIYCMRNEPIGNEHRTYIALEFIEGPSLATRLRSGVPLSLADSLRVMQQIGGALSYVHAQGLLHLDVKCSNIMLSQEDRHAVLTDFGLVERIGVGGVETPLRRHAGTVGYMAPERIRQERLDERVDVFGLGVVLYEMLTANSPFRAQTTTDTQKRVIEARPVPPSQLNPAISSKLDAVVQKALAKAKDDRYPTIAALVEDVERASTSGSLFDRLRWR